MDNIDKRTDEISKFLSVPAKSKETAKLLRVKAREQQEKEKQMALEKVVSDFESDSFGYIMPLFKDIPTRRWSEIRNLDSLQDSNVWIRARIHEIRGKGSICFLVLRQQCETLQCVVSCKGGVSKNMIKWISSLPMESIVDVYGNVVLPECPVTSTTAKCELHAIKVFCVSEAAPILPFLVRDANNTDDEIAAKNPHVIKVNPDTRMDSRALDLRATINLVIFKIQSEICRLFRELLLAEDFIEIHTPKLLGGSSEGGANVFKLKYFDRDAFLAQSPQLYKQLAIVGDLGRVFEIGPVFRAENSNTHRHLCEFVGLDMEMEFKDTYMEVVDLIDRMLKNIFEGISKRCRDQLEIFARNNPSIQSFSWLPETPRLTFKEAVDMLRANPVGEEIPTDISSFDFSTEQEKYLGKLMKEKFNTDYYIIYEYPLGARPFYSMPNEKDGIKITNSYDFFMRGEEILSGAQRIHDPKLLLRRAEECGIDSKSISSYTEAFKYGAPPHAGCGIGLERITMLFLGIGNVRRTSMFPRDPKRLIP